MIMDKIVMQAITKNINMTIPYYLMASYAYYEKDDPILSDDLYDKLAKKILNKWDDIEHYHKNILTKDMLEAGSFIGEYPSIVIGALESFRKVKRRK
tara:strand:- start:182 stop:472 length:291 start_codon:yes stop_codon:yes gene_type:complete